MRILIDTNVLVDAAMDRKPWDAAAGGVLAWADRAQSAGIAWHSLALLAYVLKSQARAHLQHLLSRVEVVETGQAEALRAMELPMVDLEDAMQAVAAVRHRADLIVTRNGKHFRRSPIPAISPAEFLRRVDRE